MHVPAEHRLHWSALDVSETKHSSNESDSQPDGREARVLVILKPTESKTAMCWNMRKMCERSRTDGAAQRFEHKMRDLPQENAQCTSAIPEHCR